MAPFAFPNAGRDPFFVKEKPFDRPRDDPINDVFGRPPTVLVRIIDAQARKIRVAAMAVYVLRWLSCSARISADRWIKDKHANDRVRQVEAREHPAREVDDADAVRLADGTECAFPHTNPFAVSDQLELRAIGPQSHILLID